ncbi:MAG: hypothetical protein GPJ52_06500 [Candidatus Heimdallarchaeota archaeon]|nr:hypothetical protein [Candidatus Heimdallarchaeota archaeon]
MQIKKSVKKEFIGFVLFLLSLTILLPNLLTTYNVNAENISDNNQINPILPNNNSNSTFHLDSLLKGIDYVPKAEVIVPYNNFLFVSAGSSSIYIFNISDISEPLFWKTVNITVIDHYLITGVSINRLAIYNINETIDLEFISYHDIYGAYLELYDGLIYCMPYVVNDNINIVDFSNPYNPITVATVYVDVYYHFVMDFFVSDGFLYVNGFDDDVESYFLYIFDISNPSIPLFLGKCEDQISETTNNSGATNNEIAIIPNPSDNSSEAGIYVFNITNPTQPTLLKRYFENETTGLGVMPFKALIKNDRAYIADYEKGLQVVDISNGSNLELLWTDNNTKVKNLIIYKNRLFAYDGERTLKIFDASNVIPIELSYVDLGGVGFGAHIFQQYGYVASNEDGFFVLNISNTPSILFHYEIPDESDRINRIWANDELILTAFRSGYLGIFDNTIKTHPTLLTKFYTNYTEDCSEFYVKDNHAYWSNDLNKLIIIKFEDPINPKIESIFDTGGYITGLFVNDSYAYLSQINQINVINVTNKNNPSLIGNYTSSDATYWDLVISQSFAYVCNFSTSVDILDISNPTNPILVNSIGSKEIFGYSSIYFSEEENYLYVGGFYNLKLFNCTNKGNPEYVRSYPGCFLYQFDVSNNFILAAQGWASFSLYKIVYEIYTPTVSPTQTIGMIVIPIVITSTLGISIVSSYFRKRKRN